MDNRRFWVLSVIILFMIVTVAHVAFYAASFEPPTTRIMGWFYAVGVEACIIITAYYTKFKTTRAWAYIIFLGLVIASGILNIGYIEPEGIPEWTYAIFPTAAIASLGFLYRQVDTLVKPAEGRKAAESKPEAHKPARKPSPVLPEWLPVLPQDKQHFTKLVGKGDIILPPGLKGSDLKESIPAVGTERTGRNWLSSVGYNTIKNDKTAIGTNGRG